MLSNNILFALNGVGNFCVALPFSLHPERAHFHLIERFHSRGQQPCKFIGTKESYYIKKEFKSHRIRLGHQHGRRFIVLGHQYGCRDVM